ncbi:MAG TPA: PadR family transcriptional regulator [Acidimicrobiales bacterium]|nr:PadR family transcriptional regulator [Acidimicrobiales bacterium]
MSGRGRANPLALAVLSCLYERPMHPYEVSQTLRFRAKDQSIRLNFGSLYSVVESLEKRGFIVPTETLREGKRPERTIYAITDTGKRELYDWLAELVSTPVKEYLSFEAALSLLPGLPPEDVARLLSDRCLALEVRLNQSRAARASGEGMNLPRLFMLEDEYRERLMEAELEFCRGLLKEIEDRSLEGIEQWTGFHQTD